MTLLDTTASTLGWDTVFALNIADVNNAIINAKTSPTSFEQEIEAGTSVTGAFGNWQVCAGGDGKLLHLKLPITSGELTMKKEVTPFQNVEAVIEVRLAYFEATDTAVADKNQVAKHLKVDTRKKADTNAAAVQVMTVLSSSGDELDDMVSALLPNGLTTWLNKHLEDFDHIFAKVNLNLTADKDAAFAWLRPTATDYAYVDKLPFENSTLAVLCMTADRPFGTNAPEASPYAIPANADAGFLINNSRFLVDMVLPNMPMAFPGCSVSDFSLSDDGNSIKMDNAFSMPSSAGGGSYSVNVTKIIISIVGPNVLMHSECNTEISPGLTSYDTSDHTYIISLVTTPNGNQTLAFQQVGTPVTSHWTTQSEGFKWLHALEIVIGIVGIAILGTMTAGVGFVVGAIIIGALIGTATNIENILGVIGTDDAPDLTLLTMNSTGPITWLDTKVFKLNSACLNQSLQLGGTFLPGVAAKSSTVEKA